MAYMIYRLVEASLAHTFGLLLFVRPSIQYRTCTDAVELMNEVPCYCSQTLILSQAEFTEVFELFLSFYLDISPHGIPTQNSHAAFTTWHYHVASPHGIDINTYSKFVFTM